MTAAINSRRVLVVDDSPLVLELARLALAGAGWDVECCDSGERAVGRGAAEPPDAVLLDVEMPGMDGPATLAALRADPVSARVPVLFLTGHDDPARRERLAALDVQGVLAKPFDVTGLPAEIAEALGWER
jgi:CheY-like chemotaxis protein